jgi:hypothetical protein
LTIDELAILDLSRVRKGEWVPPIGAMGGPPAHELYHDLVLHAGLRLLRDDEGMPWVEMQDGEHRRSFPVPSLELRAALDRFRMRRNLRPVPEGDIEEFARVIEARVSDPDIEIPGNVDRAPLVGVPAARVPPRSTDRGPPPRAGIGRAVEELDQLMREVDSIQGRASPNLSDEVSSPSWVGAVHPVPLHSRLPHRWHTGVSGGRTNEPPGDGRLPRYLKVLRELVQDGTWIGSLAEIARRTGDDTDQAFAALLRFHSDLVGNDLVVAPVELEDGWQWLVVDRGRARTSPDGIAPGR